MRIYHKDPEALAALRGSGITLVPGVGGGDVVRALTGSAVAVAARVEANVRTYYSDVLISSGTSPSPTEKFAMFT
jgi:hypothetical protein